MINPISYEERLTVIMEINLKYGIEILEFMNNNPEFLVIGHLISLTEYPVNYNKNKHEPYNPDTPFGVFEHLVYYIANAGVNANYSNKQWGILRNYIRTHKNLTNINYDNIQPKKVKVYRDLCQLIDKEPYDLTIDEALKICEKLKGVGDGCITHLQLFFDKPITLPNYSDIGFQKGFMKFYKLDKRPTKKQVFEVTKTWSNIKIGNSLMMQAYHYL
jgi:hypothetical protein